MNTSAQIIPIRQEMPVTGLPSVPVSSIRRFKDQPRIIFDQDKLKALADSIKEYGLQQPISVVVLRGDEQHDYELKDGERRWLAHQIAGIERIDVIIDHETRPGTQHLQSLIANFNREGHTYMETSNALVKEKQNGVPAESLATACGKSVGWVYQHLALQNLHPDLQKLLNAGSNKKKLRFNPAYELSKLPLEQQVSAYNKMRKIPGAAERINFIKSKGGNPIAPRAKRPAREAKSLKNLVYMVKSGVERFANLKKTDFKAMMEKLEPAEIPALISQLKAGAESLQELASFVENFQ
ncbi:MAG: ParB/RepB/Spo0J family partition protein [Parcubacteria group bacterium]